MAPRFRGADITEQKAGWVFERLIMEGFRLAGASGHYAFSVPLGTSGTIREEIDGLVIDGWQGFLVEAKFWTAGVDFGAIARLHILVEQRFSNTLGLFFSAFGFTSPAVESARLLRPIRVLLFDGTDIDTALTSKRDMMDTVRKKWALGLKFADPYLKASTPIGTF
jgi:hypothetical protein